jgi:hypothetical protein
VDCLGHDGEHITYDEIAETTTCRCRAGNCEILVEETDSTVICMLMFVGAQLGVYSNGIKQQF